MDAVFLHLEISLLLKKPATRGSKNSLDSLIFAEVVDYAPPLVPWSWEEKFVSAMELKEVPVVIVAQAFAAFHVFNVKWLIMLALMSKILNQAWKKWFVRTSSFQSDIDPLFPFINTNDKSITIILPFYIILM